MISFKPGVAAKIDLLDAFSAYSNSLPQSPVPIVLIKPPIIFSKNAYSTPITMPIGLAYIASVLHKAQYSVKVIDCPGLGIDNIRLTANGKFKVQGLEDEKSIELIDPQADIIGISIMFSQEWPYIRQYIQKVRRMFPSATLIVGGEHPTAMPEYTLRDCPEIDLIVLGEGELTFLELVHKLRTGQSFESIPGIAFIKNGEFKKTGLSPRLADIREMPWPKWDLLDIETYFRPNFTMGIAQGRNMPILATRGCPYQCTFCSNPQMWTTRYTMRPVEDVVNEIAHYIQKYRVNCIDFFDLTAIVKKDWILQFIKELSYHNIQIRWQLPSGTRSECLDAEVVEKLSKSGCKFLVYAPESGSPKTLDQIKKRVNLKKLEQSVLAALRHSVVVKINFIIGFPFETRSNMWSTLFFVWKMALKKVDDANIATFTPYPGSELFDELVAQNIFGKMSDRYFEDLVTQFDFTMTKTFCRHVPSWEIFLYRIVGMGLFYVISYLRVPSRLFRLVGYFFSKQKFQARSLFEQRVYDMLARKENKNNALA